MRGYGDMAMKSIRAFLKLLRIEPSTFAAVNVLIAGVLAESPGNDPGAGQPSPYSTSTASS
jgi:hypothetical protein